jgi:hypothetical protein
MSSIIKVNTVQDVDGNNIINENADTITVGASGDTVAVAGNIVKTNALQAADGGNLVSQSGTTITLGASGDTINVASGATLVGGGIEWQSSIVTASTLTAEAGKGYWIDTSSNSCTITLPGSSSVGDQLIFVDYARNWGTNSIIIDSNGLNYQGQDDTYTVEYSTNGEAVNIVYSGATKGWIPIDDGAVANAPTPPQTFKAIFYGGTTGSTSRYNTSNLVSSSGVVATDTTGVGTARMNSAGTKYGGDKGIFAYGKTTSVVSISNLVSSSGVIATDTTGVGTAREQLGATAYGTNTAIFAYGSTGSATAVSNLVSSAGVIATDTSGVGTARYGLAGAPYGSDKAIFAYGYSGGNLSMSNLVSNTGVIATDTSGVGTARYQLAAAGYGDDKAIFAFGYLGSDNIADVTNLVSNTGVVATDTAGVGTDRTRLAASTYGGDKAILGFGNSNTASTTPTAITNLVSNTGVVATDTAGVGTGRYGISASAYSSTA